MTPTEQLTSAINAFKQWRATRKNASAKTPDVLKQRVIDLLSHYSRGTLSNALGLSGTQVKRWHASIPDTSAFVELPMMDEVPSALSLELRLPNGAELSLSGQLSSSMVSDIIRAAKP